MSKVKQNTGIHTCAVGMTLTAAQYYEINDGLGDFLRKSDGNYWSRSEHYTVDAFREQGVWLYLSRMDTIYRVKVRIADSVRQWKSAGRCASGFVPLRRAPLLRPQN